MLSRTSPSLLGALLIAGAALTAACQRQHDEAPCAAVATHVLAIAQTEAAASSAAADETLRQRVALQLPAMRDAVDGNCAAGGWSLELRRCMLQAADSTALKDCQRLLSAAQRAALDRAAATASPDGH